MMIIYTQTKKQIFLYFASGSVKAHFDITALKKHSQGNIIMSEQRQAKCF